MRVPLWVLWMNGQRSARFQATTGFVDDNGNGVLNDIETPHGAVEHMWLQQEDSWKLRVLDSGVRIGFEADINLYNKGNGLEDFGVYNLRKIEVLG